MAAGKERRRRGGGGERKGGTGRERVLERGTNALERNSCRRVGKVESSRRAHALKVHVNAERCKLFASS